MPDFSDRLDVAAPPGFRLYGEPFWNPGPEDDGFYVVFCELVTGRPILLALVAFGDEAGTSFMTARGEAIDRALHRANVIAEVQ